MIENHQEGSMKHFPYIWSLEIHFYFSCCSVFTGIQFRGCWDGLTSNSHNVRQAAGEAVVPLWKEDTGHWAPADSSRGAPTAVSAGRQAARQLATGGEPQNTFFSFYAILFNATNFCRPFNSFMWTYNACSRDPPCWPWAGLVLSATPHL